MGLKIIQSGYYHPKNAVPNSYFEEHLDTTGEWIVQRTGIETRFWEKEMETSQMVLEAVENIQLTKKQKEGIKVVIVASLSQDYFMPTLSTLVQSKLNLREDTFCIDVNMACSGFVGGVILSHNSLKKGEMALVVGAEKLSKLIDKTDRSTAMLFGDGAGAVLFEKTDKEFPSIYGAQGSFDLKLTRDEGKIYMDGKSVYKFAVETVTHGIERLIEEMGSTIEDLDHVVLHQANVRIINAVGKRTGCLEKYYTNLDVYGNTSSASIPICLGEMEEKELLHEKEKILIFGFGGGFSYAGAVIEK